jgi:hypothetical protein
VARDDFLPSVDFNEMRLKPKRAISHAAQMASIALAALDIVPAGAALAPPSDLLRLLTLSGMAPLEPAAFRQWILRCALRDSIESMNELMNDARDVVAYANLAKQNLLFSDVSLSDAERKEEFRYLGLIRKVSALRDEYGLTFSSDSVTLLLSIGAVRNCLVHRSGVVDKSDTNTPGALVVGWRRHVIARRTAGARGAADDGAVATKAFAVGGRIDFSNSEFADIAAFLVECVDEFALQAERVASL